MSPAKASSKAAAAKREDSEAASDVGADLSFEDALNRLEDVVERLEHGELTLEESLAAYERGVHLAHQAKGTLDGMQARLEELMSDGTARVIKTGNRAGKTSSEDATASASSDDDDDGDTKTS